MFSMDFVTAFRRYAGRVIREGKITKLIESTPVSRGGPAIVAFYIGLWGLNQDSKWVADFPIVHLVTMHVVLVLQLSASLWLGAADYFRKRAQPFRDSSIKDTLFELLDSVGRIVDRKRRRFQRIVPSLTVRSNVFRVITQPESQISDIVCEAKSFLVPKLNVPDDKFNITVIFETKPGKWEYAAQAHPSWKHTDPDKLMSNPHSTAFQACKQGETIFIADKAEAKRKGNYSPGDRDITNGEDGSLCVIPFVVTDVNNKDRHCLVNYATYGQPLFAESSDEHKNAYRFFFEQYASRIQLEFILYVIKATRKRKGKR